MRNNFLLGELIINSPKPYSTQELFELINPNISEKFKPLEIEGQLIIARGLHNYTNKILVMHNKRNQFCKIKIIKSDNDLDKVFGKDSENGSNHDSDNNSGNDSGNNIIKEIIEGVIEDIKDTIKDIIWYIKEILCFLLGFRKAGRENWAFAKELGKEIDRLVHSKHAEEK